MSEFIVGARGHDFGRHRSNRTWKPNVRRVKAVVEGSPKYIYACSRCLRAGKVTRAV